MDQVRREVVFMFRDCDRRRCVGARDVFGRFAIEQIGRTYTISTAASDSGKRVENLISTRSRCTTLLVESRHSLERKRAADLSIDGSEPGLR